MEIAKANPAAINELPEDLQDAAQGSAVAEDAERRISLRAWLEYATLRKKIGDEWAASAIFGKRAQDISNSLKMASAKLAESNR